MEFAILNSVTRWHLSLDRKERAMSLQEEFPCRGNSLCKNSKAGVCLLCLRKVRRQMWQEWRMGGRLWEAIEEQGSQSSEASFLY